MQDTHITLAHGNGGRLMRELIEQLFAKHLHNPTLNTQLDATTLPWSASQLVVTTDGFIVKPLEFSGGNIGSLAIHGTVNDLAVAGAKPLYITLNAFIEEGLEIAILERLIISMAQAAQQAGVSVVAGDTKVVQRGEGGGLYLATTGFGVRIATQSLDFSTIQAGDALLISGAVGNHGIAVMLAREQFGLRGDLQSDSACVFPLTEALLPFTGLRFMRDPTRGGLATVAHEISQATGHALVLEQPTIPIHDSVQTVCDMLGYDPLYLACEGRVVAVIAADQAEQALAIWKTLPQGQQAAIIGHVQTGYARVILRTALGGERLLEELEDDPLPRIC
ncbi:hydrogenase expression/formation protein HypE [Beggiatoa leptomitoformis]|uniref:Hydrogenase expression/formation protein HypE n=1 Tax=Beggiatoa leptomitoformis TaxID=288004 RepID=A0A2N9YE59_9GAMM|nr:hydrogenase expression/formation protein HypE [Beggiatoa leptomitoformis]ALG68859.1 hydrogenase expression/formation protein HypE [Beggiatoa leptomitoformis]AUI68772.1 hydrogenase expression/formation protein HypE [Beggiatoa leptomitoformis]